MSGVLLLEYPELLPANCGANEVVRRYILVSSQQHKISARAISKKKLLL
jgi:hypothetical protein